MGILGDVRKGNKEENLKMETLVYLSLFLKL